MLLVIPLLRIVIILVVVGVALYLLNTYVPMQSAIKTIVNVVIVLAVLVWLLQVFGLI